MLRKTNKDLKTVQSQLIENAKSVLMTQLAAGIAHEVRNPLAILQQGVDYLAGPLGMHNGNPSAILKDMADAIQRADTIIRGLADLSRPAPVIIGPEDLNSIIESSLLLVKHRLARSSIQVVKNLTNGMPPINADRSKIIQVFINLFTNAIEAMEGGGPLEIKTYPEKLAETASSAEEGTDWQFELTKGLEVVEVEDSGTGIQEEFLPKVFEPFFTTKRGGGGTGLGLSIVKNIMEMHRGEIQIENRQESGVKATVRFPALFSDGQNH